MAQTLNITKEQLKEEIFSQEIPSWSRKGQFVFNYIDEKYHVARAVQFIDHVDCFYNDSEIDNFIECACKRIK